MTTARLSDGNEGESALVPIARLDRMDAPEAAAALRGCCASRRWVAEVVAGRPYGSVRRLTVASADVVADLGLADLGEVAAATQLAALRRRLHDGTAADRAAVRAELRELVRLRLISTFR